MWVCRLQRRAAIGRTGFALFQVASGEPPLVEVAVSSSLAWRLLVTGGWRAGSAQLLAQHEHPALGERIQRGAGVTVKARDEAEDAIVHPPANGDRRRILAFGGSFGEGREDVGAHALRR